MRRGKRSKAKQGKLVACPQSDYGFRYNEARDGYEVDEVRMAVMRRIFHMVGVERTTLNAVARRMEAEGQVQLRVHGRSVLSRGDPHVMSDRNFFTSLCKK